LKVRPDEAFGHITAIVDGVLREVTDCRHRWMEGYNMQLYSRG